jgi:hypothetical protein
MDKKDHLGRGRGKGMAEWQFLLLCDGMAKEADDEMMEMK